MFDVAQTVHESDPAATGRGHAFAGQNVGVTQVGARIWLVTIMPYDLGSVLGYPPPRVDHRFEDGDTIRVGPIALTAHVTAGHTRGCTSWSFPVRDGDRVLNVVSACDMGVLATSTYPEQAADRERSLCVLRSLPADIWVTAHRAFIDAAEAELRSGRTH